MVAHAVLQEDLSKYPPDSEHQQAAVLAIADDDAFNWGYDPVHYGVPGGRPYSGHIHQSFDLQLKSQVRVMGSRRHMQCGHELQ